MTVCLLALLVGLASGVQPWLLVALLVGHASVRLLICTVWGQEPAKKAHTALA